MLTVLFRCIVAEHTSAWKQVLRAGERFCMSSVRFRSLPVMALLDGAAKAIVMVVAYTPLAPNQVPNRPMLFCFSAR